MSYPSFVVIDFEATCDKNVPRDFQTEIIEFGSVIVNPESLKIIDEFQSFVKPHVHPELTDFCKELTTITQDQVDSAEDFEYTDTNWIYWQTKKLGIGADKCFASWGDYDWNQYNRDLKLNKMSHMTFKKRLNIKTTFADLMKRKPCDVVTALKDLKMQFEGTHHRGIDDAKNIARILIYLLKNHNISKYILNLEEED